MPWVCFKTFFEENDKIKVRLYRGLKAEFFKQYGRFS
jgi:hypothetical protein